MKKKGTSLERQDERMRKIVTGDMTNERPVRLFNGANVVLLTHGAKAARP
jgi:hypothetical protein